jgi:hypothetical protein
MRERTEALKQAQEYIKQAWQAMVTAGDVVAANKLATLYQEVKTSSRL